MEKKFEVQIPKKQELDSDIKGLKNVLNQNSQDENNEKRLLKDEIEKLKKKCDKYKEENENLKKEKIKLNEELSKANKVIKMKTQKKFEKCEVQERDALQIFSLIKEPNQVEYIDEILIEGFDMPEIQAQLIEQMEINREERKENEIQKNEEFIILKKEKEPLEIEYLDYLVVLVDHRWRFYNKMKKCIFQNIDTIKLETLIKPENEINYIDSIKLLSHEKPENNVEERDRIIIPGLEKEPLQIGYVAAIQINLIKNNELNSLRDENAVLKFQLGLKDKEIHDLKVKIGNKKTKVNLEDVLVIYFKPIDSSFYEGIKCLKTETFAEVEEKLCQKRNELRNTNNMFTANTLPVLRFKTIDENNIKDGEVIQLFKIE